MKFTSTRIIGLAFLAAMPAHAQPFTNFIRQVQFSAATTVTTTRDVDVATFGQRPSELAIDPGGARFELWTVNSVGPTSHLLASTYVATYMPVATVTIISEDQTAPVPRTRADRPFQVVANVVGLLNSADAPDASRSVNFYHHVQSYGEGGDGINIDHTMAQQISQGSLTSVGDHPFSYTMHSVPSANLAKARGEERFSIFSLADTASGAPIAQLASETIQIWPVADGTMAGLTNGQKIKFRLPQLTLTLNDLYPISTTYVQAYQGPPALGTVGRVLPGSALVVNEPVPQNRILVVNNYDEVVDADGQWTFELLTSTPFGIDRLAYVTFNVNRSLDVKGTFTTLE